MYHNRNGFHESSSDEDDAFHQRGSSFSTNGSSRDGRRGGNGSGGEESGDGIDNVIQVMNQLYDVGNRINLDPSKHMKIKLPQIAVCGSQSSGKTSVLESISGEEFLPRGTDIQTRCPIVLQLINTKDGSKWVEFLHARGKKFTNMIDVKTEIDQINRRIDESKLIVTEEPITLKLYSPNVPNLTLVDLPGLVENPTQGQPANLVEKINELVYKYISNEKCIILAISSATVDIADSKSIRLAKKVDPKGQRTLGVLTKLDLMDEGTSANDILLGKKIKLELGIVGVVNRSYLDVQEGKSLQDQMKKEKIFLEAKYPSLASTNGTPYLIRRITRLLMKTIKKTLPGIKNNVEQLIENQQQLLDDLGESDDLMVDDNKGALLLRLLTKFVEAYCAQVDGRRRNLEMNTLNASARIKQLFDQKLGEEFEKLVAANKLSDKEIDIAIHNSHALHSRHIDYDDAFQELAKREIKKLSPYVTKCAREVCKEMRHAIDTSCDSSIKNQYPRLYQKIKKTATELIDERFKDCQKYLDDYLNAEASIARTIRGGFRDKNGGYQNQPMSPNEDKQSGKGSDAGTEYTYVNDGDKDAKRGTLKGKGASNGEGDEDEHVMFSNNISFENSDTHRANVKKEVQLYFDGAKRQIMEHVARGIVYKLVYGTSNKITEFMLLRLHSTENAETLLVDANEDEVQERRRQAEQLLHDYEQANNVIDMILTKVDNSN